MRRINLMLKEGGILFIKKEGEWRPNFNPNNKTYCHATVDFDQIGGVLLARKSKYLHFFFEDNSVFYVDNSRGYLSYDKLYGWGS